MQRLEVSGAVRPMYGSLGVKRLSGSTSINEAVLCNFGLAYLPSRLHPSDTPCDEEDHYKGRVQYRCSNEFAAAVFVLVLKNLFAPPCRWRQEANYQSSQRHTPQTLTFSSLQVHDLYKAYFSQYTD